MFVNILSNIFVIKHVNLHVYILVYIDKSRIIFKPLVTLHLISGTGAITLIGLRKMGCDIIVPPMVIEILCTLA